MNSAKMQNYSQPKLTPARLKKLAKMLPQEARPSSTSEIAFGDGMFSSKEVQELAKRFNKPNFEHDYITWRSSSLTTDYRFRSSGKIVWLYDDQGFARMCPITTGYPEGLFAACPICLGYHPESETNPNACPKKKPMPSTHCPLESCNRSLFGDTDAELELRKRQHVITFHPRTAEVLGYLYTDREQTIADIVTKFEQHLLVDDEYIQAKLVMEFVTKLKEVGIKKDSIEESKELEEETNNQQSS